MYLYVNIWNYIIKVKLRIMTDEIKKEKKVALYLRVSTDDQAKEGHYGLDIQEERGKAFCKSRGFTLDEEQIYKDEGYSGALLVEKRPALSQLFEDAKEKKFDAVVVYKIDRMARNVWVFKNIMNELEKLKIDFHSITEAFDTSTAFGRASLNLMSMFAELEKDVITERMQSGRKRAAQDGKWVWGSPPYAFRLNKKTKKLIIHKEEAKWVRTFFKWLVDEKLSLSLIHKRANEMNVPCYALKKRKKEENKGYWHKSSITRVLCNPIYTGTDDFYRYKNGKKRLSILLDEGLQKDKSGWIPFKTDPIITPKQFGLAQKQLLKNREMADRNLKYVYLFNKLLYCGKCGLKLFAGNKLPKKETQNIYRFYHGGREPKWKKERIINNNRCYSCGDIGEARLYSIWDAIKGLLERPKYMMNKLKDYDVKIPVGDMREKIVELEDRLKNVIRKKKKIDQIYETSNTMEYIDYQRKISECKREEENLKNEITLLNQKLLRKDEARASADHFKKLFDELQVQILNASYEEKSEVIHLLVDKITLYKEKEMAEVRMNIPINMPNSLTTQDILCPHRIHKNTRRKTNFSRRRTK